MKLYRFKTSRNTYFPEIKVGDEFLYGVYNPYSTFAKIYWWLFRSCHLIRCFNEISNPDSEFPYSTLSSFFPKGSKISFNMGSPGNEQKISMLCLERTGNRCFAKYSTLPMAMQLTRNEASILTALKGREISPEILDWRNEDTYCFLRTTYVGGIPLKSLKLTPDVVNLAIQVSREHLVEPINKPHGLETALSHGDFTPWNILVENEKLQLIDWEMAKERELGYDLFTFVTQINMLFSPQKSSKDAISENNKYINDYFNAFGIDGWASYLQAFAERRIKYAQTKGNMILENKMRELL